MGLFIEDVVDECLFDAYYFSMVEEDKPEETGSKEQNSVPEQAAEQPTARDFLRHLFPSPGQMEMAEQLDRDIKAGKFTGDTLAVARRVVGLTGDASYLLSHQNSADLANKLYEIVPMPQKDAATAQGVVEMEDPIVAAFTNVKATIGPDMQEIRSARVALIRRGAGGKLRVESPIGESNKAYQQYALKMTRSSSSGPSW